MGVFLGSGTCFLSKWAITGPTRQHLQPYKELCEQVHPEQCWSIFPVAATSAPYALVPFDALGPRLTDALVYAQDRVPDVVLGAAPPVRAAFLAGLRDSDASSCMGLHGYPSFQMRTQLAAAGVMLLAGSLGWGASVGSSPSSLILNPQASSMQQQQPSSVVRRVMPLPAVEPCTVYDLTTASHHFQAGVGRLVVHNTDSVMVDFRTTDMHEAFKLGEEAAALVTSTFKAPIELEFEKTFAPYCLFSKKRYCGVVYTNPDKPDKLDAKGISLVRRDTCGLVKRVSTEALQHIMYDKNPQAAVQLVRHVASQLLAGDVQLSELTMSKSLRATYTNLQPHDVVRTKIARRSPGEEPRPGDRVEFVYTEDPDSVNRNVTCRAEDPGWAAQQGMRIDYLHYYTMLRSAMTDILEVLGYDPLDVFRGVGEDAYQAARKQRELHYANKRSGQREITSFFSGR